MTPIVTNPAMFSLSATGAVALSTGGAFTMMFTDFRPQSYEDGSIKDVAHEIARIRLTPIAFLYLERAMKSAREFHEKVYGALRTWLSLRSDSRTRTQRRTSGRSRRRIRRRR